MSSSWSLSLGGVKSSAIFTCAHSRPFALWAVETVTSALLLGDELSNSAEDGVDAVGVDERPLNGREMQSLGVGLPDQLRRQVKAPDTGKVRKQPYFVWALTQGRDSVGDVGGG